MGEGLGPERVRYRFSPLERRGVIAGWRGGQIAAVASSLVVGVLALRSRPSAVGVLVALAAVGLGVTLAFWPIRGRTAEQWLPLAARWVAGRVGGGRQLAPGPRAGHRVSLRPGRAGPDGEAVDRAPPPAPSARKRSVFGGLTLESVPLGPGSSDRQLGVVVDGPSRTATAVLSVRGHSFALLGPGDQDARIATWARVLSAMAREGSDVHRIQWIESCLPDDGRSVRDHCARHAVLDGDTPAGRSYRALVDESSPVTRRHRVLLGLSIHTARSSRSIRAAGRGMAGVGAVLTREVLALHRALDGADIEVDGVLGPRALARAMGEAYAPAGPRRDSADPDDRSPTDDPERPGPTWPWPMAVEPHWDAVHTDATWHATYWIAEWPRVEVTPDFLGPVLFSSLRRSVVLTMEPVDPTRAARQVAQARTADIADGELRRRGGFL
ncbi:MAG TPA: SCO6880 family protein, partial [Acidimicrobiales bacterium]